MKITKSIRKHTGPDKFTLGLHKLTAAVRIGIGVAVKLCFYVWLVMQNWPCPLCQCFWLVTAQQESGLRLYDEEQAHPASFQ